jgi:hypothetical protein
MAATIAVCTGEDRTRTKEAHRLGSRSATGRANTWRTFATAHVRHDGSGYIEIRRDDMTVHYFEFGPEDSAE